MAGARKVSGALLVGGALLLAGCGGGSASTSLLPPPSSAQTLTTIGARDGTTGQPVNYAGLPLSLNTVSR